MAMELTIEQDEDFIAWASDDDLRSYLREAMKRGVTIDGLRRPAVFDADERERVVEAHNLLVAGRSGEAEAILRDVIETWNAWGAT
jgi:hypothetical protein